MSYKWFGKVIFLLGVVLWQITASAAVMAGESCGVPQPGTDWQVGSQAGVGIDPQRLCDLVDRLETMNANIHSVLIVRQGKLVFERYLPGPDEILGISLRETAHGPTVKHDVRSVGKSVTSLLVGIALDRRLIADSKLPVLDFFPEYAHARTPEKERILLQHLLTMSSGFDWNENIPYDSPRNSQIMMSMMPQPYRYVLDQPLRVAPGTQWNYSGGDVALLGAIIQKVSGKRLEEFAREALFEPLGITDVEWSTMRNGDAAAASGLRLRPRDMAKLGQLVLTDGKWNGKSVVSADWLRESMKPRFPAGEGRYGYLWWIVSSPVGQTTVDSVEGFGHGGQRIIVIPTLDMVVVFTAGRYDTDDGYMVTERLVKDFILPAAMGQ